MNSVYYELGEAIGRQALGGAEAAYQIVKLFELNKRITEQESVLLIEKIMCNYHVTIDGNGTIESTETPYKRLVRSIKRREFTSSDTAHVAVNSYARRSGDGSISSLEATHLRNLIGEYYRPTNPVPQIFHMWDEKEDKKDATPKVNTLPRYKSLHGHILYCTRERYQLKIGEINLVVHDLRNLMDESLKDKTINEEQHRRLHRLINCCYELPDVEPGLLSNMALEEVDAIGKLLDVWQFSGSFDEKDAIDSMIRAKGHDLMVGVMLKQDMSNRNPVDCEIFETAAELLKRLKGDHFASLLAQCEKYFRDNAAYTARERSNEETIRNLKKSVEDLRTTKENLLNNIMGKNEELAKMERANARRKRADAKGKVGKKKKKSRPLKKKVTRG
jgi:hypothetical protein